MKRTFASCPLPFPGPPHPSATPAASHLRPRRAHVPVVRLPCCACAVDRICVLGFSTSCRLGISTVCPLLQILTGPKTKCCSSKILDNFPSTVTKQDHFQSTLETILFNEDVCRHDAVVLVDHPDVCTFLHTHVLRLNSKIAQSFPPEEVGSRLPPCS
jgi:hypothetical protein